MAMIIGAVTNLDACIEIEIFDAAGQPHWIVATIDTRYNGHLTLPGSAVASLGLSLTGQRRAWLADGSPVLLDAYRASISWHGVRKEIAVSQADGGALLGMGLLLGSRLTIEVIEGGEVVIDDLS